MAAAAAVPEEVPVSMKTEEGAVVVVEKPCDVVEDKPVIPPPHDDAKALAKVPESLSSKGSFDRDIALAKLEDEKRLSFIKAWEESEKSKVENKAQKTFSEISSWENSKKASFEAQLKKIEEKMEKKKAEHAEKMKNKVALLHKQAEEKRAMVEAKHGEELLKTEEMATKCRVTGQIPKKGFGCFGG